MRKFSKNEKRALRKGASIAGQASADKLTPAERIERAKAAAAARWKKHKK